METVQASSSRPVCKYLKTRWGCLQGDNCKFRHGEEPNSSPYEQAKTCIWYARGFCKHGANCRYKHVLPDSSTSNTKLAPRPPTPEDELTCGICLEPPTTFGLLSACTHVFCVSCIRQWRDGAKQKAVDDYDTVNPIVNRQCPYCRVQSPLVIPSSIFYPHGHPGKARTLENYKASTGRVLCRYFKESKPDDRACPFGKDCLYKHQNEDGTMYQFEQGEEYWRHEYLRRHRQTLNNFNPHSRVARLALDYFLDSSFNDVNGYIDDIRDLLARIPVSDASRGQMPSGDEPGFGLRRLSDQLRAQFNAHFDRVIASEPRTETPPPPLARPQVASRPVTAPAAAPETSNEGEDRVASPTIPVVEPRRRRRAGSATGSEGSMPSLETVSDSSEENDSDSNESEPYWRDDDELPDSAWAENEDEDGAEDEDEDEDEYQDEMMMRVELERVVDAIQIHNIRLGSSDLVINGGADGLSATRSPSTGDDAEDRAADFREPPRLDEGGEEVSTSFLTALAAMSGLIPSTVELDLPEDVDGEGEDPVFPLESNDPRSAHQTMVASSSNPPPPSIVYGAVAPCPLHVSTPEELHPTGTITVTTPVSLPQTIELSASVGEPNSLATITHPAESSPDDPVLTIPQPNVDPPPDPPFMTDGRGRVVWSRSGAKSASSQESGSSASNRRGESRAVSSPASNRRNGESGNADAIG